MELCEAFVDNSWKISELMEQGVPDCKAYTMHSNFLFCFVFPKECVSTLWFTYGAFLCKMCFTEGRKVNPVLS